MNTEDLFLHTRDVSKELCEKGLSHEGLREEYGIGHYDNKTDPFLDNSFVICSDDSGTPCLTAEEYKNFLKCLNEVSLNKSDLNFLRKYIDSRIKRYDSPRRGQCVGLRGSSYYAMIEHRDNAVLHHLLTNDLVQDTKMFSFLARTNAEIPKELQSMVIEHVKHAIFRIMFAYIKKSVCANDFFDLDAWGYLDNTLRTLWEMFVRVLLQPEYQMESTISFSRLFEILDQTKDSDFDKIRELDSAKTLLRFSDKMLHASEDFDYCMPLLFGGIEIPYALYGYGIFKKRALIKSIVPALFSLNRMRKGTLNPALLGEDGLIRTDMLPKIIPQYFLDQMTLEKDPKIIIVDNNITTGYSISILSSSLRKAKIECKVAVAEVNIQEIKGICEGVAKHKHKSVVIRGNQFYCQPVGEYVTCFGAHDSSRVINRVKLLLGQGVNKQVEGYDFDGTLFKTGYIHRATWNQALLDLGIEFDVKELPSNSGLTYEQAAENIYKHLIDIKMQIKIDQDEFIRRICDTKTELMEKWPLRDITPIAKTINLVKSDPANTKVIISNNRLVVVRSFLKRKRLLSYFSHLICSDYAYAVRSKETVSLSNAQKPDISAYIEACEYFSIPRIQKYYGDDKKIDSLFSERLECEFYLIS